MGLALAFFALYILIAILIGLAASRGESEEGFMIADRKVSGLRLVATMSAGFFDGCTMGAYTAYTYQYGLSAIWVFVGLIIGFYVVRIFAARVRRIADRLQVYTMSEYFSRVLDKKNGLMVSVFVLVEYLSLLIVDLIISGKVLSNIFPLSYPVSVIIGGLIVLSYLLLAGLKAVVNTDVFQIIIMFVMALSVGIFLYAKTGFTNTDMSLFNMSAGDTLCFLILGAFVIVIDPALWQRILAARDVKTLNRGLVVASLPLFLLGLIITVIGLATKHFFPSLAPENALVVGFSALLPPGLKEFGMVLLYAVALSSSDTMTFVISTQFTRDLQSNAPWFSEKSMRLLTRVFIVLCLTATVTTAIFYQNIVALTLALAGASIGLVPVIIGSLYWKLKPSASFWSLAFGLATIVVLFITGNITPQSVTLSLPVTLAGLVLLQRVLPQTSTATNH